MRNRSKEYIENHREYSRWIMWRCIIDRETAEYIMHEPQMRQRIAEYRRPRHARH